MIRAGITCKKILLQNSIGFGISLKQGVTCYKQKTKLLLPDHQLTENLILVFDFYEETKKDKSEFVTNFVGIAGIKFFLHRVFFTD